MEWYYANAGERSGPVDDHTFGQLVAQGTIHDETLVWNTNLPDWQRWRTVRAQQALAGAPPPLHATETALATAALPRLACAECGDSFPEGDGVHVLGTFVCARCKPVYLLRIEEGTALPGKLRYASIERRFIAKALDQTLITALTYSGMLVLMRVAAATGGEDGDATIISVAMMLLMSFGTMAFTFVYQAYFISQYGGTPGKLLLGMRVVKPGCGRLSFMNALGRALSEMVSGMICYIGYLMAFYDKERRSLHDHMAGTRVIRVAEED